MEKIFKYYNAIVETPIIFQIMMNKYKMKSNSDLIGVLSHFELHGGISKNLRLLCVSRLIHYNENMKPYFLTPNQSSIISTIRYKYGISERRCMELISAVRYFKDKYSKGKVSPYLTYFTEHIPNEEVLFLVNQGVLDVIQTRRFIFVRILIVMIHHSKPQDEDNCNRLLSYVGSSKRMKHINTNAYFTGLLLLN